MKRLGDYLSDFASNPAILLQAKWFYVCFSSGEEVKKVGLRWRKIIFVVREDSDGKEYVTASKTEATKNNQGGSKQGDIDYSDQGMHGSGLEVFKMYQLKINQDLLSKIMKGYSKHKKNMGAARLSVQKRSNGEERPVNNHAEDSW